MSTTAFTTGIKSTCFSVALLMLLYGCKGDIEESFKTTENYYYVNTLDDTVVLKVYWKSWLSSSRVILPHDSILYISEGYLPDDYATLQWPIPLGTSDSASVDFTNGKCLGFSRFDTANYAGVWNLANYRNWVFGIEVQPQYTLSYDIGARDTLLAVPCP
jgi:hypothetical protein